MTVCISQDNSYNMYDFFYYNTIVGKIKFSNVGTVCFGRVFIAFYPYDKTVRL